MQGATATLAEKGTAPMVDPDWIAGRLAMILDLDSVGPDDDFFNLGGDSTAAIALMTEIEARTGLSLEIAVLLEAPTPRLLAARVSDAAPREHQLLLPVSTEGDALPLFLVHGLIGQIFLARYLRGRLGDRPIWGVQAAPQDPRMNEPRTIEDLARDYLEAVRSVRPAGPFLIGGYCAGTYIAYEMAQQLKAAGEAPPLVFAIDPPPFVGDLIGGKAPPPGSHPLADRRFLQKARLDIRRTGYAHEDFYWIRDDEKALRKAIGTAAALRHAYLAYRPKPYDGDIVFFCSANKARLIRSRRSPWHKFIGRSPQIELLAGLHTDLFVPNDPTLPAAMKRALDAKGL